MIVAKQVADFITSFRLLIAIILVWVGIEKGASGIALVAWIMIVDWLGDMFDGRIARSSSKKYQTWIGDHDLEVDMVVSLGLFIFILQIEKVDPWLGLGYLLIWLIYFLIQGKIPDSLGMLFQAPIYGWFIWIAVNETPKAGWTIIVFLILSIVFIWPAFPKIMIPRFFSGFNGGNFDHSL